ncbi:phage tail sheath family protein [Serratia marcescens]|nr:phage tail sheath family protein [Serratia marcescens]
MGAHSVRLYFENGGGPCYVLNLPRGVGKPIDANVLEKIVPAIELCPDITLLCWCEFVDKKMDTDIYAELAKLLAASETSGGNPGRFLLTDAWPEATNATALPSTWTFKTPDVAEKTQVASYFPALLTGYAWDFVDYMNPKSAPDAGYEDFITVEEFSKLDQELLNKLIKTASKLEKITLKSLRSQIAALTVEKVSQTTVVAGSKPADKASAAKALIQKANVLVNTIDKAVREEIEKRRSTPVVLRASVAMAGVYARVDRERGVWKAPANVGLVGVTGLIAQGATSTGVKWASAIPVRIDDALNETLVKAGVNAIRAFSGQGLRVWGARTMSPTTQTAWRYVSVRRLFNTIERDARSALRTAVFEPNSPPTWERVRGALENYLNALWRQGALQGETPEQAYFVHIGLGTTMTPKDIADGKMIVKVGVAAVRPAEFIILQLTQDVVAR